MSRRRGFTLVELLVVIGIIAILITMLMPTVGRAREMARKTLCKAHLHAHGISVASYVAENNSYPHFAPHVDLGSMVNSKGKQMVCVDTNRIDDRVYGWPKFYGVLEINRIPGFVKTTWENWYYDGPVSTIWQAGLCPNMDAASILEAAYRAGNFGYDGNFMRWTWSHKWAIGYQWSPFLRATTPVGRDPAVLKLATQWDVDLYKWIMPWTRIEDEWYCTQATHPSQVADLEATAEAWDSWDIESTPNIPWGEKYTPGYGAVTPGWSGGVAMTNRRAMFNAWRHKGSPNILYANGAVRDDATLVIDPQELGLGNDYRDMWANSWPDFDPYWGNLNHLLPRCAFQEGHEPSAASGDMP